MSAIKQPTPPQPQPSFQQPSLSAIKTNDIGGNDKDLPPATFGNRFIASSIDGFIMLAIFAALGAVFKSLPPLLSGIVDPCLRILFFHYYFIQPLAKTGQTFGKQTMKIKVVKYDHSPLTYWGVVLRELVGKNLDLLTLFVGYLMALGEKKRALHDYVGGTKVVSVKDV